MAFDSPPWLIDGTTADAEVIRRAVGSLVGAAGGIVTPGDLAVAAQASPNMSVSAASGQIWIPGTSTPTQGPYYGRNSGALTVAISASNPSNPRIDTIVAQIEDAAYPGTENKAMLVPPPIVGTPTAGLTAPPNNAGAAAAAGAGAVPASSLVLAYVLVPAGANSITAADVQNVVSTLTPQTYGTLANRPAGGRTPGQPYYATDNATAYTWSGSAWMSMAKETASTGFPASPNVGDETYRPDLYQGSWWKWNGGSWQIMLVPGPWNGVTYDTGWGGSVRWRLEGDVVRLSGQLNNSGGSTSSSSFIFAMAAPPPTEVAEWLMQVEVDASPVLFVIQESGGYAEMFISNASEDPYAGGGFVSLEGWTYTVS